MSEHDEIVEVYVAANDAEAYFVRDLLGDQGIDARVVGDALVNVPAPNDATPRLWVHSRDEARSRDILAEYSRKQLAHERQPEARGTDDDTPSATWICPTCKETVDADFDLCWNCQTPRKEY